MNWKWEMDVKVQIRKDCELCAGTGVVNETPDYTVTDVDHMQDGTAMIYQSNRTEEILCAPSEEVDCPRCKGTGTETEWISLAEFAKLLERTEWR